MHPIERLLYLKRSITLRARVVEATATAMLVGYLRGGGGLFTVLALDYAVHWACSATFHVLPSESALFLDQHFTDLLTVERMFQVHRNVLLYAVYTAFLCTSTNNYDSRVVLYKTIVAVYTTAFKNPYNAAYVLGWSAAAFFYVASSVLLYNNRVQLSSAAVACFHVSLCWISFTECKFYNQTALSPVELVARTVAHVVYFAWPWVTKLHFTSRS